MKSYFSITAVVVALMLGAAPAYAVEECSDSPKIVVLPDCTTVQITTCYCEATSADDLAITIVDLDNSVAADTIACNEVACVPNGDLAAETVISDVVRRRGQDPLNATPAPRGTADITCLDCPSNPADADGETVTVDTTLATGKKNNHYDIVLVDGGGAEICTVGFNVHTQTCDP